MGDVTVDCDSLCLHSQNVCVYNNDTEQQITMFSVNTHGNRHRLTIVATDKRTGHVMRFDSAKAGKDSKSWCELMFHDGGGQVALDWRLIAAMILKAYREGHLQPKHVYRVPAWGMMPDEYKLQLFRAFSWRVIT